MGIVGYISILVSTAFVQEDKREKCNDEHTGGQKSQFKKKNLTTQTVKLLIVGSPAG